MESPIIIKPNGSCIDYVHSWLSITYTDNNCSANFSEMYKGFTNSDNLILANLGHFLSFTDYSDQDIKIIAPIFNDTNSAFHHYILSLIYIPFFSFNSFEKSALIHEVGHDVVYNKFDNKGYPFKKDNYTQMQEYDNAATESLCKISEIIGFQCNKQATNNQNAIGFKSHAVAYDLLHNSIITLFYYQTLLQNLETSFELKNHVLKTINARFNINSTLIAQYGNEKVVNVFINEIIKNMNLTQDFMVLLERIGEYINRADEDDYSSELIVRLPELIARGLDNHTLSCLEPLQIFWLNNIGSLDLSVATECNQEFANNSENMTIVEIAGDSAREEL